MRSLLTRHISLLIVLFSVRPSFHLSRSTRCTKCLFARDILHVQVHVNIYSLHEVYLGKRHFLCKGLPFYMYLLDSVSLDKKHLFISSVFICLLILCMCIRCINVSWQETRRAYEHISTFTESLGVFLSMRTRYMLCLWQETCLSFFLPWQETLYM